MGTIFRNGVTGFALGCICAVHASAMSQGPIHLDIKQIDGKPAACLPMSDDSGTGPIQIRRVGVSRSPGTVDPDIVYWDIEVPQSAPPVYLKRGECVVYGQTVAGAIVHTEPKALDVNKFYGVSIMPGGDSGPVYGSAFCVLKQGDGGLRVAVPRKGQNPCASMGY